MPVLPLEYRSGWKVPAHVPMRRTRHHSPTARCRHLPQLAQAVGTYDKSIFELGLGGNTTVGSAADHPIYFGLLSFGNAASWSASIMTSTSAPSVSLKGLPFRPATCFRYERPSGDDLTLNSNFCFF